ncbi:2-dehydropantoate 2-reductase [Anoxybacillus sp. UARK-01]|uniref:2-dehydropantoate 2-reductase n=1 Tax=Anoxybacillus sp. UARK-01 TaxID=1895648 RepID=UPI0009BA2AB3|nr:2-dehydropantoate 2-reductase [Anoxybacillus sp. UARK-01]OQM46322.1 2-dehydropantoate 2-reductase [Anoxybacillus sp. UARK-01]
MKIGIIGGGAIGLLIAAYLSSTCEVTIYTRRKTQADLLNERGLRMIKNGDERIVPIRAWAAGYEKMQADVFFVTVKQYDMVHAIELCNQWTDGGTFVFLQNGMGHVSLLSQLKAQCIAVGTVEHGAFKKDDRTVEHTGIGKISIALFQGDTGPLKQLLDVSSSDFPIEFEHNWQQLLTNKLVVNAVINPLTAMLRVPNGELVKTKEYKKMMELLFSEICLALSLPDENEARERIVRICERTANNRSSMLCDLENGRMTEIEAILGYVIAKGKEKGVQTPICQFLMNAVKGMEGRGFNG